jgi:hypothetical protein
MIMPGVIDDHARHDFPFLHRKLMVRPWGIGPVKKHTGAFVAWGNAESARQYPASNQLVARHGPKCTLTVCASRRPALAQTVLQASVVFHGMLTRPREQNAPKHTRDLTAGDNDSISARERMRSRNGVLGKTLNLLLGDLESFHGPQSVGIVTRLCRLSLGKGRYSLTNPKNTVIDCWRQADPEKASQLEDF